MWENQNIMGTTFWNTKWMEEDNVLLISVFEASPKRWFAKELCGWMALSSSFYLTDKMKTSNTNDRKKMVLKKSFPSYCVCVCVLVAQSCPALCNPTDCSPPSSSVHGIQQTRILEWVAILFSRASSQPKDWTWVSFIAEPSGKPSFLLPIF